MTQSQTVETARPDESEIPEEPSCRHHWRIESPNGATSSGRCKICGEVKEFSNSSTDSIWENENSDSGSRWRGRGRGNAAPVADVPAATNEAPPAISENALGRLLGVGYRGGIE